MRIICLLLTVYLLILLVRVVLSWVPRPPEPVAAVERATRVVTDPVVLPLRRVIPPAQIGAVALDLSILVVFFGISILQGLLC